MVKFLFGLFIVSRIIKIFNLLRGKDISNVDEAIEKVEYVYKFSGFKTFVQHCARPCERCRNMLLIIVSDSCGETR